MCVFSIRHFEIGVKPKSAIALSDIYIYIYIYIYMPSEDP